MTAPVSLDKIRTVKDKPIPYGFLLYPGSWFYLIVTSVIGLLWIAGLVEATKIGAFAVDHLQEFSLQRVPFAVSIMLLLGLDSARTMYIQLKFSQMHVCCQKVGTKAYLGFCILGWLNFFGWPITGLIALFTLPNPLVASFFFKLYLVYGMPLNIWTFWCILHDILMECCAKPKRRRLSSFKNNHPA